LREFIGTRAPVPTFTPRKRATYFMCSPFVCPTCLA
jgi:hypothetical protein